MSSPKYLLPRTIGSWIWNLLPTLSNHTASGILRQRRNRRYLPLSSFITDTSPFIPIKPTVVLPENHELHIISTPMPQTFTLISFLVEYHLLERLGPVTNNKTETEIEIRFVFLENWTTLRGGGVDVKWTLDSSSHGKEREVWCLCLVNYVQYRP